MSDSSEPEPPVTSIEIMSVPDEPSGSSVPDTHTLSLQRHVFDALREAQRSLLSVKSLSSLVKYLLEQFPAHFGSTAAEIRLHDPEGQLAKLLPVRKLFGESLVLKTDSYALYQLYPDTPSVSVIDLDDPRMFRILSDAKNAAGAAMLPLFDGNRLVGSYHIALPEIVSEYGDSERDLFAMLGQLVASALLRVVEYQRTDQLTLLDPVTEMGNLRAFRRDMLREIYWARRVNQPLSLLSIALDDLEDLSRSYGEVACHFVQRRVSQRLCSDLRATDYIARTSDMHFAIMLPSCSEPHAHEIGERMRCDIDGFAVDDGRGAVLYVTLSIGLVCWEPARHPVESSERLASQMESEAHAAMLKAERSGGNRVSVARIGLLML